MSGWWMAALGIAWIAGVGLASAAEDDPVRSEIPLAKYRAMAAEMEANALGLPVHVEGQEGQELVRGDVYGITEMPFDVVRSGLESPASWCEIFPLHFNVKSCTHAADSGGALLTLRFGRKYYQRPSKTRRLELEFVIASSRADRLEIVMHAEKGPMRTRDYALTLSAVPLEDGRSLLHFSYTHARGWISRVATFSYLKTIGRKKVGFSVVEQDARGRDVLVGGEQGMMERNAMRYHLAIRAYLETLALPEEERFERRAERWYDLTAVYPAQLFEMEKDEYLGYKRREWADQSRAQKAEEGRSLSQQETPLSATANVP